MAAFDFYTFKCNLKSQANFDQILNSSTFHLQDGKRGKGRNVEISSSGQTSNPLHEKGTGEVSSDYILS